MPKKDFPGKGKVKNCAVLVKIECSSRLNIIVFSKKKKKMFILGYNGLSNIIDVITYMENTKKQ